MEPIDSPAKNGMDAEKDLEMHQKNGKNGWKVYKKILLPYKKYNRIFNDPKKRPKPITLRVNGAMIVIITQWDALCYLYTINICFSKKDCKNLFRVREMRPATNNKHLLEVKTGKDYQPCIWCINYSSRLGRQKRNQVSNNISTEKNNNGTMQKLQSYSELVDRLKNDRELREFHGPTDEWLIDQEKGILQ